MILLQIERIVQSILKNPTAKSLNSSDSVLDSVSRAKCRELWEMMFTQTEEVKTKLRSFRRQIRPQSGVSIELGNPDHTPNSSDGKRDSTLSIQISTQNPPPVLPLVDSCIDWWADRLSKLQAMSYRQDSNLLFRIHLKRLDKVTLNSDFDNLKDTLKKMEGFANVSY